MTVNHQSTLRTIAEDFYLQQDRSENIKSRNSKSRYPFVFPRYLYWTPSACVALQIFISHPYEVHCNVSLGLLHIDFEDSLIPSGFRPKVFHAFPISQFMAHVPPPTLISWTWSYYYHLLQSSYYEAPDHVIFFILPHFRIFCRSKEHFLCLDSVNLSNYVIYLVSYYVRHIKFVKK